MEVEGRLRRGWGRGLRRLHGGSLGTEESPSSGTTVPGIWRVFGAVPGLRDLCSRVLEPGPENHGPSAVVSQCDLHDEVLSL